MHLRFPVQPPLFQKDKLHCQRLYQTALLPNAPALPHLRHRKLFFPYSLHPLAHQAGFPDISGASPFQAQRKMNLQNFLDTTEAVVGIKAGGTNHKGTSDEIHLFLSADSLVLHTMHIRSLI